MSSTYWAAGKLMLTGEYSVLRGVPALAVPTRAGQKLVFTPSRDNRGGLTWKAYNNQGGLWLDAAFDDQMNLKRSQPPEKADLLARLISYAFQQGSPLSFPCGLVETHLEFDRNWGWGSSSSLVALVAQWSGCDLMELYRAAFQGSGYDAAVGYLGKPLIYRLDQHIKAQWQEFTIPPFWKDTYLLYRGQKQDSQREVARFSERSAPSGLLEELQNISLDCLRASKLDELIPLLQEHEKLTARMLGQAPVQEELFPDFPGVVKSLGAWGGDYLWVLSTEDPRPYFEHRTNETLEPFSKIVAV